MLTVSGIGRLGREPKMQYLPNGTAVTNLNVAVSSGYGDKQQTTWFQLSAFGKMAETLNQYLNKADRLFFTAEFQGVRTYEKSNGETGIEADAKILSFSFLEPIQKSEGNHEPEEF